MNKNYYTQLLVLYSLLFRLHSLSWPSNCGQICTHKSMDFQKSKCTCLEQLSILTVLILPKAGFTVDIVDFDVVFVVCVFCINRSLWYLTSRFMFWSASFCASKSPNNHKITIISKDNLNFRKKKYYCTNFLH